MKWLDAPLRGDESILWDALVFPVAVRWDGGEHYFFASALDGSGWVEMIYNLNPAGFVVEGLRGKNLLWIVNVLCRVSGGLVWFRTDRVGLVKMLRRFSVRLEEKGDVWVVKSQVPVLRLRPLRQV